MNISTPSPKVGDGKRKPRPSARVGRRLAGFNLVDLTLLLAAVTVLVVFATTYRPPRRHSADISCINNLKQVGLAYRIWSNEHEERFPWQVHVAGGGIVPDRREIGEAFGEIVNAFRCISNELTVPKVLVCPLDNEREKATTFEPTGEIPFGGRPPAVGTQNLSYFAGWDARETSPQGLLSGDSNLGPGLSSGVGDAGLSGVVRKVGLSNRVGAGIAEQDVTWARGRHADKGMLGLADGSARRVASGQELREVLAAAAATTTNGVFRMVFTK